MHTCLNSAQELILEQERQKAAQGKGKLGKQLEAQKTQTQTSLLAENARENVAAREAVAANEARSWN